MFQSFDWRTGIQFEDSGVHASRLSSWSNSNLSLSGGTHFGFVVSGEVELTCSAGKFRLRQGMYFAVPDECQVHGEGNGMVVTRLGFRGLFQVGGPVEQTGRLRYIDGCSDTLLISPVVLGDACLNLLHIPPHTDQTRHTHPSLRAGVIFKGSGTCDTPTVSHSLDPGTLFVIPADQQHSFHTTDSDLLVIAYHPDSDFGPQHDDHPMVNRTIVDGVAANKIAEIRT